MFGLCLCCDGTYIVDSIGGKRKAEEGIGNKPKILRTRSEPLNLPDEEFRKKLGSSDYNLAGCANKQLI